MANKTKEEAEKTRQAILDAALEVFTQNGFSRTTLKQIAHKAGYTRGAVYGHFAGKAELFKALYEEMDRGAGLALDEQSWIQARSLNDIKQAFIYYIDVLFVNKAYRDFYEMVNYKTEWSDELVPLLEFEKKKLDNLVEILANDIANLQRLKQVKVQVDPVRSAVALCAYVEGIIGFWLFNPETLPLKTWASSLLDDFLAGLADS
jgi:TetR/AcrR family acrAB operon transcriptional repressor